MAEVEPQVFLYTGADRLAEERVETNALTLAELNATDFFKKITNIKAGVKVKTMFHTLAERLAHLEMDTLGLDSY